MLFSPVNSTIKITRLHDKCDLDITFKDEHRLGNGSFGCAYQVSNPLNDGMMVCKVVDLQGKSKNFHLSHHHLLRLTYREITYLQKVNMLIGYHHDTENHKMYILMKYIRGRGEWGINKIKNPQIEYLSFCALRECHRLGIAHNDPHQGNFIVDPQLRFSTAIDFGLAKDHTPFREIRDFYKFFQKRREARLPISLEADLTWWHILQFYCKEMQTYIQNHKLEMAKQVFIYSAILISAYCGVSMLGAASLIAQQLIKMVLFQALSEICAMLEDIYEIRAWNQIHRPALRRYYQTITGLLIVLQGLLIAVNLSSVYSSAAICWQEWVNMLPTAELAQLILGLKPLVTMLNYWKDFCEKYLASDDAIIQNYADKIQQNGAVYLPQYVGQQGPRVSTRSRTSHFKANNLTTHPTL